MSTPVERVREIHAKSLRQHESHMRRFNRMLIGYLAFAVLVTFSSIIVLTSPELLGVQEIGVPTEYRFSLVLMAAMGVSLFGFIMWQQWRMTRFTRLTIELLELFAASSSSAERRDV